MSKLPILRMPTMSQMRLAVDGNYEIRRGRRADQQIDVFAAWCPVFASKPRTASARHMRGAQPLALEDVALLDAGALGDPCIAGVDHARQLGIGEDVRRHIAVDGGDRGAADWRAFSVSVATHGTSGQLVLVRGCVGRGQLAEARGADRVTIPAARSLGASPPICHEGVEAGEKPRSDAAVRAYHRAAATRHRPGFPACSACCRNSGTTPLARTRLARITVSIRRDSAA